MKTMNRPPVPSRNDSGLRASKTFASAVAALATAMLALGTSDLMAASGTWQDNPADQGVNVTITVGSSAWAVAPQLMEGDSFLVGATGGVGLGTDRHYYYVVGVGSTPSDFVRFSTAPGGSTFSPNGVNSPFSVSKIPAWSTAGNWAGGIVPNGIDDAATIATTAGMGGLLLDHDITLGALNVDTTVSGANGLSLIAGTRNGGPLSTLTLQRSSGTPTITLTGGNSFSFSESKISGTTPGSANSKLIVVGDQGLVIDNQNPIGAPIAVNSGSVQDPVSNVPTFGSGQVRFGFGLDWSKFSGDLTLSRGVFQPLAGGSVNNNLSSLPLQSKLVLGTGSNTVRFEIPSFSGNNPGSTLVRGLVGTANSSIINTSTVAPLAPAVLGGVTSTFAVGMYSLPGETFTYAGNIGDAAHVSAVASASAVRLVKMGPSTQILSGVNNMDTPTANSVLMAVNGGKLSLGTTGAIGTITNGQGATSANSSIVLKNGEFELSGLGTGAPRSQAFGGFLIYGTVTPALTNSNPDYASQSNSSSTVTVIADPAQPATLTFGALKPRSLVAGNPYTKTLNGVTSLYRGTNLGAAPGPGVASVFFTTAPVLGEGSLFAVDGGASLGTARAPVLRGALADTSPTGNGAGFATYDPATGVRLLAAGEQTAVGSGAAYDSASSNDNILFNLAANEAITGHVSNTLHIKNVSGQSRTVTNSGTALNAANGLLFSGADPIVLTGGEIIEAPVLGVSSDIVIHSVNTSAGGVTIQTPVTNLGELIGDASSTVQGWITYAGSGDFRLEGVQTVGNLGGIVFSGKGVTTVATSLVGAVHLSINHGIVNLDTGASWTNVPRLQLASGAKLDLNGIGGTSTTNRFSDISAAFPGNASLAANMGGELTNSALTPVDLYLSGAGNGGPNGFFGTITGNLNLIVDKSSFNNGTQVYTYNTQALGNANTYTGSTQIRSGVLNLARGGSLPPTTVVTLGPVALTGAESYANSTLSLGDANGSTNGAARIEIAGLYATGIGLGLGSVATGNGTAAVINASANVSQLTLNIAGGVENVFTGNLGITATANGNSQNLFGLRKTGAGVFEPAGAINTYAGGVIVEGGFFRVSSDDKLGQIAVFSGAAGSADAPPAPISAYSNKVILDGGALQASASFTIDSKRGIGLGSVSGSTGGTGSLWVDSGVTLTYDGIIASAGNTGSQTLVKNGTGLLLLGGASTFTGVTQVSAGALGGTGSLASGVTVDSGGAISPGVSGKGTFTINGPLTFNAGSALNVDLDAPGDSDLIQLAGGAVSATGTTTVNITALAGFGVGSYTLVSGGGAVSASNFVVGAIPSGYNGTFSSAGGALTLTIAEGSALTGLETWRHTNFGNSANTGNAADTFDADGDGVVNLLEYATGTNPNVANASPVTVARDGNFLTLTYTRIADTTLTYTVEGTSDLTTTWTTVTTGNNPSTGVMNTAGPVTVTDTTAITSRRFLRLKVSY